ncbi:trna/Rrna methyltransferase, partial [Arthrobacter sp. Hiyo6]
TGSSVDIYNPKAVRSTAGSLFHLPVVLGADVEDLAARFKERGIGVLAADGQGQLDLDLLQDQNAARRLGAPAGNAESVYALENPTAWLFGNEAQACPRRSFPWPTTVSPSPFMARRKASTWARPPRCAFTPALGPKSVPEPFLAGTQRGTTQRRGPPFGGPRRRCLHCPALRCAVRWSVLVVMWSGSCR